LVFFPLFFCCLYIAANAAVHKPPSSKWVAKECRKAWQVARFIIFAAVTASLYPCAGPFAGKNEFKIFLTLFWSKNDLFLTAENKKG